MPMRVDPVLTGVLVPLKAHGALPARRLEALGLLGFRAWLANCALQKKNGGPSPDLAGLRLWDVSR